MSIGIYKITNKINNKCYIGQSVNLESRIRSHKSMLKHHNEDNDLLNKATQKYGYENFEIEIIKYCKENELDFYEKYYINFYNSYKRQNGYNIELGGSTHKHLSEEQINRMKNSKKGKLTGVDNPFYGKKHTELTKNKISQKQKGNKYCVGRIMSQETRNKIGNANMWHQVKKINCYDLDGNFIKQYKSIGEAGRFLKKENYSSISAVCKGKRKTAYGFIWKYADEELQK